MLWFIIPYRLKKVLFIFTIFVQISEFSILTSPTDCYCFSYPPQGTYLIRVKRIFAIRFATCLIRLNLEARAVILCFFQYAFFCQNCQSSERKIQNFVRTCKTFRACLKNGFRKLRVPVCGRFCPNEGGVAGYGNRMRAKSPAKWGLQIAEMVFQTRSSV